MTRKITDTALSRNRITSYSYNVNGLLISVNGPRTDVNDYTTYSYNGNGTLATVTDALGYVTTFVSRDAMGRPTLVRDPNGLETTFAYDSRGNLITVTKGNEITTFTYDGVGNIGSVTLPSGASINYTYDNANRLIKIADAYGSYISYTLDLQGNISTRKVYNSTSSILWESHTYVYDELNRLIKNIGAADQTTLYGYDKNNNLVSTTDPLLQLYGNTYDGLNRLISQTDPLNGVSTYTYDVLGHLSSVTDPNAASTSYTYDALGNLLTQTSPDSGVTSFTHDAAGNVLSRIDAKGQTTSYQHDALNRLSRITYAGGEEVLYGYDSCTSGKGHLCTVSTANGSISLSYDLHGRVTTRNEDIVVDSQTTTLSRSYQYNAGGQLLNVTYPSGMQVAYSYDLTGVVSAMSLNGQPLLESITHRPFGPIMAWSWSGGGTMQRGYDLDSRLTSHSLGSNTRSLSYDANNNISAISDPLTNHSYGYDFLNRLTSADGSGLSLSWSYDANGNRLSETDNGTAIPYIIQAGSNRLQSVDGVAYQHDANGSLTQDGADSYQYDVRGRLVSVDGGATGAYRHNGMGQRVYKQSGGAQRLFAYDSHRLLGEYDVAGNVLQETIWLGDLPVVTVQGGTVYRIYPDHLGAPRVITNAAGTELWRWDSEPFGEAAANEDVDGDGVNLTYNLRFPGQYFDAETGLHYNYFRTYVPGTGRYLESDPLGLDGGLNTYLYTSANPLSFIDPMGLAEWDPDFWHGQYGQISSGTNCYGYARNVMSYKNPGDISHVPFPITCSRLMDGAKKDGLVETEQEGSCGGTCQDGYYKVQIYLDDTPFSPYDRDYHVYRQDNDGGWSHKRGRGSYPQRAQSCPMTLPRKRGGGSYNKYCGTLCVKD